MSVKVRIPTPLRQYTNEASEVVMEGKSLGEIIHNLEVTYHGIKERILDDKGQIRRFINVYVNDEDVRFLKGLETETQDGDVVSILPAIAGGNFFRK